jgi:hypothetical protein
VKKGRNNKQILTVANQPNRPDAGSRRLKPESTTDTIRPRKANQTVFDAVENKTAVGRAKRNQILETAIAVKKTKGPKQNPRSVDLN